MSYAELSQNKIDAGRDCLALLDAFGLGVQGAVWLYVESIDEWRFFVVTSLVDIDGLTATHDRIEKLFRLQFRRDDLTIDDIHLGSPNEGLFQMLASAIRVEGGAMIRLKNVQVNGLAIIDALVYRLDKAPKEIRAKEARMRFDKKLRELEKAGSG